MNAILNERKFSSIISAVVCILLGVVLLIWPDLSALWICRILGIALLVVGICYIISFFIKRSKMSTFQFDIILGIVLALLGAWLLIRPDMFLNLLSFVFGAILVVHGVIDIQAAFQLFRAKAPKWWISLLLAVLTILLGILIIFNPFAIAAPLVIAGIALIFDGVSDLIVIFRVNSAVKAVKNAVEGRINPEYTVEDDDDDEDDE